MPKQDGYITPDKRKGMPSRGKGKQTLILESIKKAALLGLSEASTNDDAEIAVFKFMAESAFNPTADTATVSSACLTHLMSKGWPSLKPQDPLVEFDFDKDASPSERAGQIMNAVAGGSIPPSLGVSLLSAMSSVMKIEEVTSIKADIERIKEQLGIADV